VPDAPELPGGRRVGVSFYFGTETIDALEKGLRHLKDLAQDTDHRGRVSKSDLVELAVLWALADLEARGAGSALASLVTD
jgi:hypothetical protein